MHFSVTCDDIKHATSTTYLVHSSDHVVTTTNPINTLFVQPATNRGYIHYWGHRSRSRNDPHHSLHYRRDRHNRSRYRYRHGLRNRNRSRYRYRHRSRHDHRNHSRHGHRSKRKTSHGDDDGDVSSYNNASSYGTSRVCFNAKIFLHKNLQLYTSL